MEVGDKIIITDGLVASSYRNAKLNRSKGVVTIIPNLRSYFFEWGLHLLC